MWCWLRTVLHIALALNGWIGNVNDFIVSLHCRIKRYMQQYVVIDVGSIILLDFRLSSFQPTSVTKGAYSHLLCSALPYSLSGVYHGIFASADLSYNSIRPDNHFVTPFPPHHCILKSHSIRSYFPTPHLGGDLLPKPGSSPTVGSSFVPGQSIPRASNSPCQHPMHISLLPRICTSPLITYTIVFISSYRTRTRALKKKKKRSHVARPVTARLASQDHYSPVAQGAASITS